MKVMNKSRLLALGLLTLAASATTTRGDVMTLTFQNVSPGAGVQYSLNSGANFTGTTAGVMNWVGGYETFCIQLQEYISGGQQVTYNVLDVADVPDAEPGAMGAYRASLIEDLYARNYASIASAEDAAAFQVAIWEIVHERGDTTAGGLTLGNLGLSDGTARFNVNAGSNVVTLASGLLAGLGGGTETYLGFGGLRGLSDDYFQDQLIVVPGPGALAGIIGVAAMRRRRRRG
jgi:hypothetical protein